MTGGADAQAWPLRRIEQETGVRRETAGRYLRGAGIAIRPAGQWGHAKPAKETIPDSEPIADAAPPDPNAAKEAIPDSALVPWPIGRRLQPSTCEAYREIIDEALARGRNAKAIYQDLVSQHGFSARYASVTRSPDLQRMA